MTAVEVDDVPDVLELWWLPLVSGLASIGVGIAALANPEPTLTVITLLFGVYLLFIGALEIGMALADDGHSKTMRVLFGALAVVAGLLVVRHPGDSLLLVALAVGIFLVLAGIVRLVAAVAVRQGRGVAIVRALVDLAAGVVLVAWPEFSVTTFAVVLGIMLLLRGMSDIALAFVLRRIA